MLWAEAGGSTWQEAQEAAVQRLLFTSRTTMLQTPLPLSPVETSDHTISFYISDGFFSHVALCCNGTSTHENTHGKLFEDISPPTLSFPHYRTAGKCASFPFFVPKQFILIIFEGVTMTTC